ncbi:MAG: hypothetical protein NTV63_00860 [Candidatus Woesearchaeota archaeon]|nr:hypothetical protein [Candidatus Woesearchaeota archaeon]
MTFPELTESILKKVSFNITKRDLNNLLRSIKKGHGNIVNLNKDYSLKIQYHGRFKSFLIGFGINEENPFQPDFKLVRVETIVEKTHTTGTMAFLGESKLKGPHLHWYNNFYGFFVNEMWHLRKPTESGYKRIIKMLINNEKLNFSDNLLKRAVPYNIFVKLFNLVILKRKTLRNDGYITIDEKLKENPKKILGQIINRELF